jgi:hypothetical protein
MGGNLALMPGSCTVAVSRRCFNMQTLTKKSTSSVCNLVVTTPLQPSKMIEKHIESDPGSICVSLVSHMFWCTAPQKSGEDSILGR